jgi:hypothetical protein
MSWWGHWRQLAWPWEGGGSKVPGCGAEVRSWTVGMVRSAGELSGDGVVVMGIIGVTMLHPQGPGKLELSPLLEAMSPSLEDVTP